MFKLIGCCIVILFFLAGCCTTTGDPRQGGLFCWSPKKAQQRKENLIKTLKVENTVALDAQAKSKKLAEQEGNLKVEYTKQQRRLDAMKRNMAAAEKELKAKRYLSQAKETEKQEAEQQLAQIKQELENINKLSEEAIARKKGKISKLNRELEALLQVIANL